MIRKSQTREEPSYSALILELLSYPYDSLTTNDVANIYWLSDQHASNILRQMWRKGWLSREVKYRKPRRRYYRYYITEKGYNLFLWLSERGVFEE